MSKIKVNDNVLVIAGDHKKATGKVLRIDHESGRLFVEGVNRVKRHMKATPKNPTPGIVEKEASIAISNVALMDASGKASRIKVSGTRTSANKGKDKKRVLKTTNQAV